MLRGPLRASPLVLAMLLAASRPASAQTKPRGALDQLDAAPAGDAFFSFPSADVVGKLRISAQLVLAYAHDPLVLRRLSGGPPLEWVRNQAVLHAQLSLEALHFLKLDLTLPGTIAMGGASGTLGQVTVNAPSGAASGDLRASLRAAVLHQRGYVPSAALGMDIWAPVGNADALNGAGSVRVQPTISIGAEYAHFIWGASLGARLQPTSQTGLVGSRIVGGAGAAVRWFGLTAGPEIHYQVETGDVRAGLVSRTSGAGGELLIGARYKLGPIAFGLAGGPGFGHGPGTPTYRLLAALTGTLDALPPGGRDGDGDGGEGANQKPKPEKPPAPMPSGPLDTDGDGVPDTEDACPTIVGDPSPTAHRRGCPPDRDRDGIFDVDDRCPDVPGVTSTDPQKNGCPPDTDGDGITDDKDACPREKGEPSADPKKNGCPTAVRVEGTQIIILQQVNFETARDEIKADSFALLGQVAAVMKDHPEIARVAVDGHTDNRGGDKPNVNLSERRAVAVVRWLVENGVDARRLEARGFGARRPIADNKNEAGRAKNRRVEFQIRRRTNEGEAGWRDGPVEEAPNAAPQPKK